VQRVQWLNARCFKVYIPESRIQNPESRIQNPESRIQNPESFMPETTLPDELRYQLLKQLEKNPEISQRALAKAVGISLGKTNYCLKALVEAGWVKAGNFARSEQKLNYAYLLTPKGLSEKAEVTVRFLKRKQMQYEKLEHEIASLKKEAFAQEK